MPGQESIWCVCATAISMDRVLGLEESSVWNIYLRQEVAGNLDTFYLIFFYLACLLESISFDGRPWYSGVFVISTRKLKMKKKSCRTILLIRWSTFSGSDKPLAVMEVFYICIGFLCFYGEACFCSKIPSTQGREYREWKIGAMHCVSLQKDCSGVDLKRSQ